MQKVICISLAALLCSCNNQVSGDEKKLSELHHQYVNAWLANDKQGVLSLFTDDSRLQPSSLCPIKGIGKIEEFWFPNDGSVTTINTFKTELVVLSIRDTLAFATHTTFLDWSYKKDTTRMHVAQTGIATSIYSLRNNEWKIWRQMWSDLSFKSY